MLIMIIIEKLSWLMLRLTHVYLYMGNHTISIKSKRFFFMKKWTSRIRHSPAWGPPPTCVRPHTTTCASRRDLR